MWEVLYSQQAYKIAFNLDGMTIKPQELAVVVNNLISKNIGVRVRMLALLGELKRGHAVLLVEHDMDAVFRIADRTPAAQPSTSPTTHIAERY